MPPDVEVENGAAGMTGDGETLASGARREDMGGEEAQRTPPF